MLEYKGEAMEKAAWVVVGVVVLGVAGLAIWSAVSHKPATTPQTSAPVAQQPTGTISGKLGYPSDFTPAQVVCAEDVTDSSTTYCTDVIPTQGGNPPYQLKVPAGTYYVYAKLTHQVGDISPSYRAYYNEMVRCGLQADCPTENHKQYIRVSMEVGDTITGIDPQDWYFIPELQPE